ncbi:MAG TPA: DUF2232 domain-containing protein [Rectinemataceae bacterium]|nr:DUF2232 domain-containing protein [Rectinemataceae bacterium]
MTDGIRIGRSAPWSYVALAMGAASASFWLSIFLAPLFLVPIQLAYGRLGRRGGWLAIAVSILILVPGTIWRVLAAGGTIGFLDVVAGVAFPMAAIAAMAILNASFLGRVGPGYRILALGLAVGALAAPAVAALLSDAEVKAAITQSVAHIVQQFVGNFAAAPGVTAKGPAAGGYDMAAALASLDPAGMVDMTLKVFASSYAALICLLFGGSWWIGNRIAGEGSPGRRAAAPLSELRAPEILVWPFLGALGLLLIVLYVKAGSLAQAAAWNLVLAMSLVYAAQGMGIVSHVLRRLHVPGGFRIAFAVGVFVSAIGSPIGAVLLAILPLLGVTELWIPYRNPKGVGA